MTLFEFEQDFAGSLRCIPMVVRYKLDTCGVKLSLEHWAKFESVERRALVVERCESLAEILGYAELLQSLITEKFGVPAKTLAIDPNPLWLQDDRVPESVGVEGQKYGVAIGVEQWRGLSPLQRFSLIKLSRSGHENRNFEAALREFDLW
jgi:hypothetical protein